MDKYFNQELLEHALDHLDEWADTSTETYEEKSEQEKSYNYLLQFIRATFNQN